MVNHCVVWGCNFKYSSRKKVPGTENVSLHAFPSELTRRELREAWVKAIKRDQWVPSKTSAVCSQHFRPQDMDYTGQTRRLRDGAVPSVFPSYPKHLQSRKVISRPAPKCRSTQVKKPVLSDPSTSSLDSDECERSPSCNVESSLSSEEVGDRVAPFIGDSDLSPRKMALNKRVRELSTSLESAKKKVKVLQQKVRRQSKRLDSNKEVIQSLVRQSLLTTEAAAILENSLPPGAHSLVDRALKMSSPNKKNHYDPELRAFALTLHYYSPKAYEFVREKFNNALPSPRTIRSWYIKVNCEPGFSEECFNAIKLHALNSRTRGITPSVCLSMDDMSLKESEEFDGVKVVGYADMGTEVDNDFLPKAKMACVIMCTSINDHWKIPCGYFFAESLSGVERANLVVVALEKLHKIGVHVAAFTFDGASSNITMASALGAHISEDENLKVYFPHPFQDDLNINILLDPCHMLKLIRNTLTDTRVIYCDGKPIKWSYIDSLYDLQSSEGLRLANKLNSSHIHWKRNKMKVRPAAQTFSDSVADALEYCARHLQLDDFQGCEETVLFIRYVNNMFDLLNSSSFFGKSFKAPLRCSNEGSWKTFIAEAIQYLGKLSVDQNGSRSVLSAPRKMGFLGFKVCLLSVVNIFNRIVGSDTTKYLLTYKLSQDHLEIFFGLIRQRGGWNNNPNCRQFKSAFKRLIIRNELKSSKSGNTVPQEEVNMLHVSSTVRAQSSQFLVASEENFNALINDFTTGGDFDHDYIPSYGFLTVYVQKVVEYIAGFVVKAMMKALHCEPCKKALVSEKRECTFISFKDKGGLIYPSKDVVTVCELTEKCYREFARPNLNSLLKKNIPAAVVHKAVDISLFDSLKSHILDLDPMNTHLTDLIRIIAAKYIHVRVYHTVNERNRSNPEHRSKFNRIAIFKNL